MKPIHFAPDGKAPVADGRAAEERGEDQRINILLIDDQPANLLALETLLEGGEYSVVKALSGTEGLRCLLEREFALVLLDVLMPGIDGFETAALIRDRKQSRDTPIIFITAANTDENHVSRGYSLGAVDYIYKPIVPEILKAKVQVFAELHRKTQRLKRNESALRRELDEHRKTAAARLESEEKYRELFSRANDAIIVYDSLDGGMIDANDAAVRLYGYSRQKLLDLTSRDLIAKPERGAPRANDEKPDAGRSFARHQTKDGRVFAAEITHVFLKVGGRAMTMTLTRDLSEHEKAEAAERLQQREVMQRQMIATVSHELRTPIAAIKASAETLRYGAVDEPKERPRFLKIIENHADRLSGIVEDLLLDAEIESGKIVPKPVRIALKPFLERIVNDIVPLAASKKLLILVDMAKDMDVWVDPDHLSRIFHNLIDNAIKYNKKGGSVRVSAVRTKVGEAHVAILDTGIGIEPDDLPRIFQQFYRADKVRALSIKGTGLGLSILKTLAESNGGRIWAESDKKKGSTFHLALPLARPVRPAPKPRA